MLRVFVYGTLKPGEAYYSIYCEPLAVQVQPALTQGQLYHLPQGYPALTVGKNWVTGALLHFRDDSGLAALDAFEDYDPTLPEGENEYQRQCRPIYTLTRQPLGDAWMYVMQGDRVRHRGGIAIPSGVWSRAQWPSILPEGSRPIPAKETPLPPL
jgi:gamma-glutamylcyclotransferase (GGCT)/AIG2-like uncharacterized protein YtfP